MIDFVSRSEGIRQLHSSAGRFAADHDLGMAQLRAANNVAHLLASDDHAAALQIARDGMELAERLGREEIKDRPVLSSWTALLDYLQVALTHEPIEQFRVLFLDRKNILIKDKPDVLIKMLKDKIAEHDASRK